MFELQFVLARQPERSRTGWLAFPLTLRPEAPFRRRDLKYFLEMRNIQTRVVFTGNITRQPGFRDTPMHKSEDRYPDADKVMKGDVLLACHHGLIQAMLDRAHESLADFAKAYR